MRVDNPTAAPVDTQVFTSDGTWVMPPGARLVQVCLIAAGGGGTSGWRGTPADFTTVGPGTGGANGEGGGWAIMTFPAANLTGQVAVTVGVGGVGDIAAASDGGFGTGATDGGATSFGGYLTVAGGRYPLTTEPRPVIGSMITPGGGSSADAAGCPAGGFGGGMQFLTDVVTYPATQGGRSTLTANPAAAAGVTDGVLDGEDGFSQVAGQPMPGSGGGGGAASQFGPAGNGGNGGNYGAGGGGGGASGDGYPAGNGGRGGDGIAFIITSS